MSHPLHSIHCATCSKRFQSVFCNMDQANLELVNEEKVCTTYKKGQVVFHEGSRPLGVYCVHKGKLRLSQTGDDGKEQILRLVKDGDIMGYRALLTGDPYQASAIVMEEAQVCFLPKDLFVNMVQADPSLNLELIRLLGHDLKEAERHVTHMAQKPVRERVAEALLLVKETYGYEPDGKTLNLRMTREELANLVGTATETVIRLLSDFNKSGVIHLDGKKIQVIDERGLVKEAHLWD